MFRRERANEELFSDIDLFVRSNGAKEHLKTVLTTMSVVVVVVVYVHTINRYEGFANPSQILDDLCGNHVNGRRSRHIGVASVRKNRMNMIKMSM